MSSKQPAGGSGGDRRRPLGLVAIIVACLGVVLSAAMAPAAGRPDDDLRLNESTFARWREFIPPKKTELAYRQVDWRPSLWDAVLEAQRANKPILLWAMNGNPLSGCT